MGWPQITVIALMAAGLAVSAVKHGERRPPFSLWWQSANVAITSGLLYAGGFFGA